MATRDPRADARFDVGEPISPELALVDAELAQRAREMLRDAGPESDRDGSPIGREGSLDPIRSLQEQLRREQTPGEDREQRSRERAARVPRRRKGRVARAFRVALVCLLFAAALWILTADGPPGPTLGPPLRTLGASEPTGVSPGAGTDSAAVFTPRTLSIDRVSIGGVRLGHVESQVRAAWGTPTRVRAFPQDGDLDPAIRVLEWRYGRGGAYVALRDGSVVEVKADLAGTMLHTTLGDGARTPRSAFLERWRTARSRGTAVETGMEIHYYLPSSLPDYLLVFTFPRDDVLETVALMARSTFFGPRSLWLR